MSSVLKSFFSLEVFNNIILITDNSSLNGRISSAFLNLKSFMWEGSSFINYK